MSERKQNVYQHLLTKSTHTSKIPSLHMFSIHMHTSEDTKCISSRVATEYTKCISARDDQTHPLPARTQKLPQHAMTKPNSYLGHRIHLNTFCANNSYASENTKCNSNCETWQRGHKVYLIACWQYTSQAR